MSLKVSVTGQQGFGRFAYACYKAAKTGVDAEFKKGLKDAGNDVVKAVKAATDIYMPKGFERTFKSQLTLRVNVKTVGNMSVSVTAFGRGRSGRRDVERMERGDLRHPVFGRWRERRGRFRNRHRIRNPWVLQRIRPGWFSEPAAAAAPKAVGRIDAAVGRVLDGIGKDL